MGPFSDNNKPALSIQIPRIYWDHIKRRTGRYPRFTPTLGRPYDNDFVHVRNLSLYDDRGGLAPSVKPLTSVCGQEVFRGDAWPSETYGNYGTMPVNLLSFANGEVRNETHARFAQDPKTQRKKGMIKGA